MSQQPFLLRNGDSFEAEIHQAMARLRHLTQELEWRLGQVPRALPPAELIAADSQVEEGRPPQLEIRCLGRFQIYRDGDLLDLSSTGQRLQVLKVLAHFGEVGTSRRQLIGTLWPDAAQDRGANHLRVTIHRLRRDLGEDVGALQTDGGRYRLVGDDIQIDADRFEQLVARGDRLELEGRSDDAIDAYERAAQLYRGDYFEKEQFEDWPVLRRLELRDRYLNLILKQAAAAFDQSDHQNVITRCHEVIRYDNSNEDAYQLLMRSHLQRGNHARALRWFELCEQTLLREFGVSPSESTIAVRQEVIDRE